MKNLTNIEMAQLGMYKQGTVNCFMIPWYKAIPEKHNCTDIK